VHAALPAACASVEPSASAPGADTDMIQRLAGAFATLPPSQRAALGCASSEAGPMTRQAPFPASASASARSSR
jgi:hypothetical protein